MSPFPSVLQSILTLQTAWEFLNLCMSSDEVKTFPFPYCLDCHGCHLDLVGVLLNFHGASLTISLQYLQFFNLKYIKPWQKKKHLLWKGYLPPLLPPPILNNFSTNDSRQLFHTLQTIEPVDKLKNHSCALQVYFVVVSFCNKACCLCKLVLQTS